MLYERGQRGVDFFLVLSGAIEVFDFDELGRRYVLTTHRERQFTGEMNFFNHREILVSATVQVRCARRAHPARAVPEVHGGGARYRGNRHARLHPAPRRFHPARTRRRAADRPRSRSGCVAHAAFHDAQRLSASRGRRRRQRRGDDARRIVRSAARASARADPSRTRTAAQSRYRSAGRCAGPHRNARRFGDVRRGRRRRGTGRSCRRRIRGVGRIVDARARIDGAGRAGGHIVEDRKLSGISHRNFRAGACRPRAGAGAEVRRASRRRADGGESRLRESAVSRGPEQRTSHAHVLRRRRHRRALSKTRSSRLRALRRFRHPLRGDGDGSATVRRRGSRRDRRRQLGRAGGRLSVAIRETCARRDPRREFVGDDVGLSHPAHRILAADFGS